MLQIPLVMFLLTHAYFCLYHALSNIAIRRTLLATKHWGAAGSKAAAGVVIFVLAYTTAFMETFTISQVCTAAASSRALPGQVKQAGSAPAAVPLTMAWAAVPVL